MTIRRHASVIAAVLLASASLAACSTVSRINPFHGRSHPTAADHEANRISLLELNDQLQVSSALKGQDFYLPPPRPRTDWPTPGGSVDNSVENVAAAPNFHVVWRRHFGQASGAHAHVMAPPVAADGKIFVMDAGATVSAHDLSTGAVIWRANLKPKGKADRAAYGGGLAYAGGKLYVASGFRLVAEIDAASGHVDWVTRTDAPIHDAPTVADGRVYTIDVNDEMLTFNAANGTPDWTYQALTEPARMLVASSPAVLNDTVVASFASGELVALRADNGTELWNQPLSRTTRTNALSEIRDIAGRPVIYKGDVFAISHADVMAATDLRTGDVRWQIPVSAFTTPWAAGDVVFAVDDKGRAICAARDSGQLYWLTDLNETPAPSADDRHPKRVKGAAWSSPILADNRLVMVSSRGEAVALDAKTGQVAARLKIGGDALIGPIAVGDTLYVVTQGADLIAIR